MRTFFDRLANEPALVVAAVLAVAALFGKDLSEFAGFIESAVVIVAGFVVRSQVTPVRSL